MDQATFLDPIRKFRIQKLEPSAHEDDIKERFQLKLYKELASLGITSTSVPESDGGLGLSSLHYAWALEEIARSSIAYAVSLSVSGLVQTALIRHGNSQQKAQFLSKLSSGEYIGSFALTEPTAGSDASSLATKAEKKGDHYILTGAKQFITNGGISDVYLVMARTGGSGSSGISAFLVPANTPGLTVGKKEMKMGWRASPTTSIHLDQCKIPKEALLSQEGKGFTIAMQALDSGRVNIAALSLGLCTRALEESSRYACERKQFGQPIIEFQGVGFMLADMQIKIEATRALLERACAMKDAGESYSHVAASLKCFATDAAMNVTTDAVQVLGGYGYTMEYPLERFMRDAKVLQIVEGTNQIQRVVLARYLQKQYSV